MSIRPRILIAAAVIGLVGAACNTSSNQPALCNAATDLAVVNGAAITCDDLYELRPEYGDADILVNGEALRSDLTGLIQTEVFVTTAEEDFGLSFSEADVSERLANPPLRWAALLTQPLSESELRSDALISLISDGVVPELVKQDYGDLATFAAQRPQDVVRVCLRTIVVLTEQEAIEAINRIDAGEEFLDVRSDYTIETSLPDGLLVDASGNCPVNVAALGEQFALAAAISPIGEVAGPVPDSGGAFHVIRVEERVGPDTTDDLEADFLDFLDPSAQSTIFSPWASDALRTAEIEVATPIGRWSPAGFGIAPPGFNQPGE